MRKATHDDSEVAVKPYILIVDDEPDIRQLVREILEEEGYAVAVAKDGASARESVKTRMPDMVLLDIWMPDIDGISLLKEFISNYAMHCPVVMMSGHGTVEAAVEATRLGASNFIEKPLSLAKLLAVVEQTLAHSTGVQAMVPAKPLEPVEFIGKSIAMQTLRKQLDKCAQHDITVILQGEPGVGKSHCAHYIHQQSPQHNAPFISFSTASVAADKKRLALELLLGKQKGKELQSGCIRNATGGTLYISDIAELSDVAQASLYGALNTREYYPCDGSQVLPVNMRLIAATHHDLQQEVRAGRFREDLYLLLRSFPVFIVPLREHSEDIPELLDYYVSHYADEEGLAYRHFSLASQNRLRNYAWPGNIVELEQLVKRLLIQGGNANISVAEIDELLGQQDQAHIAASQVPALEFDLPLRQAREQFERAYLSYHLGQADGSVGKVAKLVGMERTHLYRKLRSLGIDTKHLAQDIKDSS